MPGLIETVVFSFEKVSPQLETPPLAARRALDHAGARLSQESWRSLLLEDREAIAFAGGQDIVDVEHVLSLAKNADPAPARIAPSGDPDEFTPSDGLVRALEPKHVLDGRRWSALRALDRYALVHAYRRGVARGSPSQLVEAFESMLAMRPLTLPPPRSMRHPSDAPQPGYYSQTPSDPRAISVHPISTHLDAEGHVQMVDVGAKQATSRVAVAEGSVSMRADTARKLASGETPKGDVLATARVAGILAAKRTPEIIPLCHHVALSKIAIAIDVDVAMARAKVTATAEAFDRTGVEMEALTAVSVACLTIYDMLKGIDRAMTIDEVRLLEKSGGKNGNYRRGADK